MRTDLQIDALKEIAVAAGQEILAVYNQEEAINVSLKGDNSPVTEADRRAHRLIVDRLASLTPEIPILSEEADSIDWSVRSQWDRYWLVDPLDGTKEFIKRNGEFTVNIALIHGGIAEAGVVHVPVSGQTYVGRSDTGAWRASRGGPYQQIGSKPLDSTQVIKVVASRSHRGELLDRVMNAIESELNRVEVVNMGSSLKICLLAEGSADIYPRFAPTSEWDTAAGHAVLSAAGGEIYDTEFRPLRYNQKDSILNPFFIGIADTAYDWKKVLTSAF